MCLAQGHNAVTLLNLEPVAPPSQFKLSTTEPLRSPVSAVTTRKMPERASKYTKYQNLLQVPKLLHLLVLNSTEHGIFTVHKCKEMLAFKQYI